MTKVSVLVPVKNDKRIIDLIHALEKQTFKDFEVLIADDSEKRLFYRKTKLNLRYFHTEPMSIAEKFDFLVKEANGKMITITESDCAPSENWLKELVSEYEDDRTIIVGTQRLPGRVNYGNLLLPKSAFEIKHDTNLKIADDTDWFITLGEMGFKFKEIDKAVVLHYKDPVKRLFRSYMYGKEHAYIYIKHKEGRKILKSIAYRLALSFFSFVQVIFLIIYGIYYKIKFYTTKLIRALYEQHWEDFHLYRRIEWDMILNWFNMKEGGRVCDVGCGRGFFTKKLAGRKCIVYGIDNDKREIKKAKEYNKVDNNGYIVADGENIPFKTASFDAVITISSLEHFKSDRKALKEMNRVLRLNGNLFLTVDSLSHKGIDAKYKKTHAKKYRVVKFYTTNDLKKVFSNSGFELKKDKYVLNSSVSIFFHKLHSRIGLSGLSLLLFLISYPLSVISDKIFGADSGWWIYIDSMGKEELI